MYRNEYGSHGGGSVSEMLVAQYEDLSLMSSTYIKTTTTTTKMCETAHACNPSNGESLELTSQTAQWNWRTPGQDRHASKITWKGIEEDT